MCDINAMCKAKLIQLILLLVLEQHNFHMECFCTLLFLNHKPSTYLALLIVKSANVHAKCSCYVCTVHLTFIRHIFFYVCLHAQNAYINKII